MPVVYVLFSGPVALTAAIMALLFTGATPLQAVLVYFGTGTGLLVGLFLLSWLRNAVRSSG